MNFFLLGALALASAVAALFFLRFWVKTADRFFLLFALSFALGAVERLVMAMMLSSHPEGEPLVYLLRLLTFALILIAIVDKNRNNRKRE